VTTQSPDVQGVPDSTGSRGTRVVGVLALISLAALALFGLVLSPPDANQGEVVRILYVHVPSATFAYIGCFLTTIGSAVFLWRRSRWWETVAYAGAEIAAVFTTIVLVTGMIWGRPTWGVYWVWDARLTSTAMLLMLLLGYLAVRRLPADHDVRTRRAAIIGLLLVPNVMIVRQSVQWWRTLHQKPTLLSNGVGAKIEGLMLFSLFVGFIAIGLVFVWLLIHRFRLAWLEDQVDEAGLDVAIAERRAEGAAS
jgi:heme exporter protein C